MRSRISLIVSLAFLGASTGIAQMRNMADEPSAGLKNVRKVAVFINMGATLPAPYTPDFERVKKQITNKLNDAKLSFVVDPKDADAVIVMTEYNADMGDRTSIAMFGNVGTAHTGKFICLADSLRVFPGGKQPSPNDPPLWSADDACGFSWPANRLMDKFTKALKKADSDKR